MVRIRTEVVFGPAERRKLDSFIREFGEEQILLTAGAEHFRWINDNFIQAGLEKKWKPLSPNTLANPRRGSNAQPLRDKGTLSQSFVMKLSGKSVDVGSSDKKAPWHHFGTKPFTIRPKGNRTLRFFTTAGVTFSKIVHHPGIPKRRLLPSKKLGTQLAQNVVNAFLKNLERSTGVGDTS